MIKIFTLNENKKIELSQSELKELINESYREGYLEGEKSHLVTSSFGTNTPYNKYYVTTTNVSSLKGE